MTKKLSLADEQFRKLVVDMDGRLEDISATLGINVSAVSARLRADKHHAWWVAYKARRSKERLRARERRSYAKRKEAIKLYRDSVTGDPALDVVRALLDAL